MPLFAYDVAVEQLVVIRGVARVTAACSYALLIFTVLYSRDTLAAHASESFFRSMIIIVATCSPAAVVALSGADDLAFVFRTRTLFWMACSASLFGLLYMDWGRADSLAAKLAASMATTLIGMVIVRYWAWAAKFVSIAAGLGAASLLFFALTYRGSFATHAITVAVFTLAVSGLISAVLTSADPRERAKVARTR